MIDEPKPLEAYLWSGRPATEVYAETVKGVEAIAEVFRTVGVNMRIGETGIERCTVVFATVRDIDRLRIFMAPGTIRDQFDRTFGQLLGDFPDALGSVAVELSVDELVGYFWALSRSTRDAP